MLAGSSRQSTTDSKWPARCVDAAKCLDDRPVTYLIFSPHLFFFLLPAASPRGSMDKGCGPCSARGHPKMQDTVFAADCAPVMVAQNSANPVPWQQVSQGRLHTFKPWTLRTETHKPYILVTGSKSRPYESIRAPGKPWTTRLVCPAIDPWLPSFCW